MTRSQATPASSQIITLTRLLEATQDALDKERKENAALREAADDVLTFASDAVSGWQTLAPQRVTKAAVEALERLRAALEVGK